MTSLASDVRWAEWCSDGLHAIVLLPQQMAVVLVPSGRLVASHDFIDIFRDQRRCSKKYVSLEAQAVLVPMSLDVVSLRTLPSLQERAQLSDPTPEGARSTLSEMGWADHGSLVVVAWWVHGSPTAMTVSVHSSCDGVCCQSVPLDCIEPPVNPADNDSWSMGSLIFSACPDQALAAVASSASGWIVLLDLATGAKKLVRERDHVTCHLYWAPYGRHLMLQEIYDHDEECIMWLFVC